MKTATIKGPFLFGGGFRVQVDGEPDEGFLRLDEAIDAAGWRAQALKAFERLKAAQDEEDAANTVTLHSANRDLWRVKPSTGAGSIACPLSEALHTLARHREAGMRVTLSDRAAVDLAHHRLRPSDITQASAANLRNLAASLANGDNPHLRSPTP